MNYSVNFLQSDFEDLQAHLFSAKNVERAAYLICRISISEKETRLLVREIIPVNSEDTISSSAVHIQIESKSFIKALKRADDTKGCFIFIHTHPEEYPDFSSQDDVEESKLFKTAYIRIKSKVVHGSIIFSSPNNFIGRIWLENGQIKPISTFRVIGDRLKFYKSFENIDENPAFFDRQIKAFGAITQKLLSSLKIGIIGVGGTGSALAEQLIRLGAGELIVADGQSFEFSNVNRVYGSRISDSGLPKVKIVKRQSRKIGLGTRIISIRKNITYQSSMQQFRDCDVIFGCSDDQWGRSILARFSTYYMIPVFDMGVKIDSVDGVIKSVEGRVTTLLPQSACLACRGRIDSATILAESIDELNPEQARLLREEGYIPELAETAPAVIPFTSTVASLAVSEFMHRITGFLGNDRVSNETLVQFHNSRIRTNHLTSKEDCYCGDSLYIGRGDSQPFLDLTWRPE